MTKALLLIDVKKAFLDPAWGPRNRPKAKENMKRLLNKFRTESRPVLHAQHISNQPHIFITAMGKPLKQALSRYLASLYPKKRLTPLLSAPT